MKKEERKKKMRMKSRNKNSPKAFGELKILWRIHYCKGNGIDTILAKRSILLLN